MGTGATLLFYSGTSGKRPLVLEQWPGKRWRGRFGFRFRRYRIRRIVIEIEKILFIEFDRSRILPDVIRVVNSPGQAFEIARFNGFELPGAQLGRRSDLIKADAFADSPRPDPQDSCLVHSRTVLARTEMVLQVQINGI